MTTLAKTIEKDELLSSLEAGLTAQFENAGRPEKAAILKHVRGFLKSQNSTESKIFWTNLLANLEGEN